MTEEITALPDDDFRRAFMRDVLRPERIAASVDRVLGERLELGPVSAGAGARRLAKVTAVATYRPSRGQALADDSCYLVEVPVHVAFDLDLAVETLSFEAEVLLPLDIKVLMEPPLTMVWEISPPAPEDVTLELVPGNRVGSMVQKAAGLDDELRRFLVKVVDEELAKPHVQRATRINISDLIDSAWPALADHFLPPADASATPVADAGA